jgi:AsmA protein
VHGLAELRGQGATLGALRASADGRLALVAEPGRISRLLMEQMGLHLLEMLRFSLAGDQAVALRCAVADFAVQQGVMTARHLALDTAVSNVSGSGQVDLGKQVLDLTLVPQTRQTSLVALRGPIRLHGPLAAPEVQLDTPGIVARGAGALALGLVNPLLALAPLVEPGRNPPSACAKAVLAVGISPPKAEKPSAAAAAAAAASAPAPRAAPSAPPSGTRAGTAPPAPSPSRP